MSAVSEETCLRELKDLIKDSGDPLLESILNDDQFLRIFIVGRKYNVKYAFETVEGYMKGKYIKHREIYEMTSHSVEHVLRSGLLGTLKNRDHRNRVIGFMRFGRIDIKTMEHVDIIRAITLFVETCWNKMDNVRNGQVLIADFSGYNWSIMTRYTISQKITMINMFWHNHPAKIKGVHIIHNPKLFGYAYSIIRPFFPDKFKKRARLHGRDLESFHQFISPKILPVWLGGKLSDEEAIDFDVVERILKS